jgi:hypothetical protein
MGRGLLRFLQVMLVTAAGLVVVPVAVNIETGGDAPGWLKPYTDWLWPVGLACALLVAVLEFLARREDGPAKPASAAHPDDPRNARRVLAQISHYIEGRRQGALDEKVRLALALDERPETVRQTVHLVQRIEGADIRLSADHGIADVFEEMDGSLLILGAPGAGKTTLLLDLASVLVSRADDTRIPVVVDLADWSRSGARRLPLFPGADEPQEFEEWLLVSLRNRYHIPIAVGRSWLAADRLILLLDGLDEVRESVRGRCVNEINRLQELRLATRVVVCSREADYERLAGQLRLQGAVSIRPLTRAQVMAYFDTVSPFFARTVEALRADDEMWDLLTTPLMLHILALAQSDTPLPALPGGADPLVRRGQVFDAYLVEVLARRRYGQVSSTELILHALRDLASGSVATGSGVRCVLPSDTTADKVTNGAGMSCASEFYLPTLFVAFSAITAVALAVNGQGLIGLVFGALMALLAIKGRFGADWRSARIRRPWTFVASVATVEIVAAVLVYAMTVLAGHIERGSRIELALCVLGIGVVNLAVPLIWDRSEWRMGLSALGVAGVIAGFVLAFGVSGEAIVAWAIGSATMACLMIFWLPLAGVISDSRPADSLVAPIAVALACLIGGLVPLVVVAELWSGSVVAVVFGFVIGLATTFLPSLPLSAVLVGPTARLVTHVAGGLVPWHRSFLKFAADRSILTRAEGEYRFIHLLIRDHLAACEPERLAVAVDRRRAELRPA